jgi:iron-sulfur cluster repair protein YtfE (RIC family)
MTTPEITLDMTVNSIVEASPETLPVFKKYGIDTCCGGALPIGEVAKRHQIDSTELVKALDYAVAAPACCM